MYKQQSPRLAQIPEQKRAADQAKGCGEAAASMLQGYSLQRSSARCGSSFRSIWSSLYLLCLLLGAASTTLLQPVQSSADTKDHLGRKAVLLEQDSSNTAQAWLSDREEASREERIDAGVKQRRANRKRDRRLGLRVRLKTQDSDLEDDESRPGQSSSMLITKAGKRPKDDAPAPPEVLAFTPAQVELVRRPITIGIMTSHFFGSGYAHEMEGCNLEDVPLRCTYKDASMRPDEEFKKLIEEADALWYHAPSSCMLSGGPWAGHNTTISPFKHHAGQLAVIMSMESSVYYRCLDDPAFMQQFDVDMTYRKDADIPTLYWGQGYRDTWEKHPPLPQGKKKDAVVFINSNCGAPSRRNEIVKALMEQPGITVDSYGHCLNNQEKGLAAGPGKKYDTFRKYKYCIAIENSIAQDYVTEKIYDALAAGCLPIYLGAPNIVDYIPSHDAIIDYNDFRSPEALAAELKRLSADEEAYEAKFAWRNNPDTWGPSFKRMTTPEWARQGHTQCQLCRIVARRRIGLPDSTTAKLRLTEGQPNSTQIYRPAGLVPFDKIKRVEYKIQNLAQPQTIEDVIRR